MPDTGIRVAHVIAGLAVGGAERNLVNLLNALPCEYRSVVLIGDTTAGTAFYGDLRAEVFQHRSRIRRRFFPFGVLKLASLLKYEKIDVVHTHMFESSVYGALAAKIAGVPVIVTSEHGENPWKSAWHRWIERRVISPLANLRLCVSPQILALRRDLDGVPAAKLLLAVNGTRVPPPKHRHTVKGSLTIGSVGRAIAAKDYPSLLRAVAALIQRGLDLNLCIVGDGPEMLGIRRLVNEYNLGERVLLPGMVSDVESYFDRFDIYVSSSIREGQPVALLEAMASGLPVIATDVGASAETLGNGLAGVVVPAADTKALERAIEELATDPERRAELRQKCSSTCDREIQRRVRRTIPRRNV